MSKISTNNINIGAYSKYGYKSANGYVLYTRFCYTVQGLSSGDLAFWIARPITSSGTNPNTIKEILEYESDLVIAEGVRFTISNVTPHDPLK